MKVLAPGIALRKRIVDDLSRGWSLDLRLSSDLLNAIIDRSFFAGAFAQRRLSSRPQTPDEKIAAAKRLLFEATRERRLNEQLARAADRCACGHRRDEHALSHSINYTEGYCMSCPEVKGHSACAWFNYQAPNAIAENVSENG